MELLIVHRVFISLSSPFITFQWFVLHLDISTRIALKSSSLLSTNLIGDFFLFVDIFTILKHLNLHLMLFIEEFWCLGSLRKALESYKKILNVVIVNYPTHYHFTQFHLSSFFNDLFCILTFVQGLHKPSSPLLKNHSGEFFSPIWRL